MARTEYLRVRVSIAELSQIDQLAAEHGLRRAAYVRDAALGLIGSAAPVVIPDAITIHERRQSRIGRILRGALRRRAA